MTDYYQRTIEEEEEQQQTLAWLQGYAPKGRVPYFVHHAREDTPAARYVSVYLPVLDYRRSRKVATLEDVSLKLRDVGVFLCYRVDRVGYPYPLVLPPTLSFEELIAEIGRCVWQDEHAYRYQVLEAPGPR